MIVSTASRPRVIAVTLALALVAAAVGIRSLSGAAVPSGFSDSLVASVGGPTALAFTPDGRLLVTTKAGQLYVVRNGTIVPAAALNLSANLCTESERGLLGVAVDPAFATNNFVYLFYTAKTAAGTCPQNATPAPPNRVSASCCRRRTS